MHLILLEVGPAAVSLNRRTLSTLIILVFSNNVEDALEEASEVEISDTGAAFSKFIFCRKENVFSGSTRMINDRALLRCLPATISR